MKKLLFLSCVILSLNVSSQIINIPADYSSIQEGIDASSNGDTVLVQPGIYYENLIINGKNIVLGSLILTTQDTSYISQTIIDGNLSSNVLEISSCDSTLNIKGFIIQNGWGEYGAGVNITNSGGILDNLVVKENIGFDPENQLLGQAPGIYCNGGTGLKLRNIRIENNYSSTQACALWFHAINNGELLNLTINNNHNALEGISYVVLIQESKVDISNIEIFNNHGFDRIIYFDGTTSSYFINNLFVHDNTSNWILCGQGTVVYFNNLSIVNNDANNWLYHEGVFMEFYNSILWNTSSNAILPDQLYVKIENSCYNNAVETLGNISSNPLFIDVSNYDYHLSPCSPCIGAGSLSYGGEYDLNNDIRPTPVGSNPDMGVFENILGLPLTPPLITQQPLGIVLCEGDSHTLTVQATGSPELIYQWQKNGTDISGQVNNILILNNLVLGDEANYRCLVSNSCETIVSNQAFVEVLEPVTVVGQPENQIVYYGNDILFEIISQGDLPITYQWYGPSGIIENEVSNQLLIENVSTADTGTYYCNTLNSCGEDNSNSAKLTAFEQLVVNAGSDIGILSGESAQLDGSYFGGSSNLSIQWSPESLVTDPSILNPQTISLFTDNTFILTVIDNIVGYQTSDSVLVSIIIDDTLNYYESSQDTMYTFTQKSNCGFVSGTNCDNDKIKAQFFSDEMKTYELEKVLLRFGKAIKSTEGEVLIKVGIWDNSDDNTPGNLIEFVNIALSQIVNDIEEDNITEAIFSSVIDLPKEFYLGVFLPENDGDTLVLMTNKDGHSESGLSWTLNSVNEWLSYSSDPRYFLRVSNAIFPVVKLNNLGLDELMTDSHEFVVYPNPSRNILNIKTKRSGDIENIKVNLYSSTGQKVITISRNVINVDHLHSGLYFIEIISKKGKEVQKIVIQ